MKIEPFLIASTVRAVVGQRLVRRLCIYCRQKFAPEEELLKRLGATFHLDKAEVMKYLHDLETQALAGGIGKSDDKTVDKSSDELASTDSTIKQLWRANPDGCENCNHSGYRGRIGIYEVLDNTHDIQKMIVTNETSENIQNAAIHNGMVTMQLDGLVKSLRGWTTIEEVLRVTAAE